MPAFRENEDAMPDGVTVTAAEMYALLLRIDAKVSSLVQTAEGFEERIADHEARLRVLEAEAGGKPKVAPTTVIALLIAAASVVTSILLFTIDH